MQSFGLRFKMLRTETGLNQEEFINDFNRKYHYSFTKSAVSQYENDKRVPEINALTDFADYFDVSVDYLLCRTDIRDIAIMEGEEIPEELREVGIELMEVHKTLKNKGLTPEDIVELIEDLDKIGLLEKYQKK